MSPQKSKTLKDPKSLIFAVSVFLGLVAIVQPAMGAPILYGGAGNFGTALDGSVITIDQNTGAGTLVGTPSSLGITGLAFDSNGNLYGSTIKGGVTLEKIDPNTGLQLSSISLSIGMGDLSFQPVTDVLFGISQSGVLYRINVSTGAETLVGDTGTGRTGGLGFAPDGTLYLAGVDPSPNTTTGFALLTLNPLTGAILTSVRISLFYDGLGVRPTDGVIFGNTAGVFGDNILTINPINGGETFLGSTNITKVSDLAFQTVPEPGTWMLFGAGAIGLTFWTRSRRGLV